jgi:ATP-dependent DNA helicase HFM1/MER3
MRFPVKGRIKTTPLKISVLVQSVMGGARIEEWSIKQEAGRALPVAQRIAACAVQCLLWRRAFPAVASAVVLCARCLLCWSVVCDALGSSNKCLRQEMWEEGGMVLKQLDKIGPVTAAALAAASACPSAWSSWLNPSRATGITSFGQLLAADPRRIEQVCGRAPPFGNVTQEAAGALPRVRMEVVQTARGGGAKAELLVRLAPAVEAAGRPAAFMLLVGSRSTLLFSRRVLCAPCSLQRARGLTRRQSGGCP